MCWNSHFMPLHGVCCTAIAAMNTPSQDPNLAVSRREVLVRAISNVQNAVSSATNTDRDLTSSAVLHLPAITESFEQVQGLLTVLADGDDDEALGGDNALGRLPNKKRKLEDGTATTSHSVAVVSPVHISPMDALGIDMLVIILSFLEWESILLARVCRRMKEAATLTSVVKVEVTKSLGQCLEGRLNKLAAVLPGIETLRLDPDAMVRNGKSRFMEGPSILQCYDVDLSSLRAFHHLREVDLYEMNLNGSYPALFKIESLEKLDLGGNPWFRCDLSDLVGLPSLTHIKLNWGRITGSLLSLNHLRDRLECLGLMGCDEGVVGSLMDLASFKKLQQLNLAYSSGISGDIRDIGPSHFISLQRLRIEYSNIFGGSVPRVSDGQSVATAWRRLLLQRGVEFSCCALDNGISLSPWSGENYFVGQGFIRHEMTLIRFGEHAFGFQWAERSPNDGVPGGLHTCDINWVDLPSFPDGEFRRYLPDLAETLAEQAVSAFRGLLVPPTDEESRMSLIERYLDDNDDMDASHEHVIV